MFKEYCVLDESTGLFNFGFVIVKENKKHQIKSIKSMKRKVLFNELDLQTMKQFLLMFYEKVSTTPRLEYAPVKARQV